MATKKQQKYQAQRRKRRRIRRLILLAIFLAFIFIPERTVDAVTEEAPVSVAEEAAQLTDTQSTAVQTNAVKSSIASEVSSSEDSQKPVPNKAKKTSDSPSQQFVEYRDNDLDELGDSSNNYHSSSHYTATSKPQYTKDKNGLYNLSGPVIDAANLLSMSQYNQLESFLLNLDDTTGVQIAVLTVPSLNGVALEEYSIRHAEKWQLGQKGVDNGALLLASMEEHALRIETGYGTEGTLTDAKCAQIIRNVLVPNFRDGKYGEGIIEAVNNMAGIITSDESLVSKSVLTESSSSSSDSGFMDVCYIILAIIIIIIFLGLVFGGSGSGSYSGGHSSSSGRSYSSGGHSFSGGGGHFGGGGASGHW